LIARTRALGHPLCVGLDPYLDRIPKLFRRGGMQPQHADTAQAVEEFCCRVIDLIAADVAIVKPQVSLFECLGWRGWRALERVVRYARTAGLLVLLDAKRGDIADTAAAYAQAYLSQDSECSVDAITVNPYLGPESLEPFIVEWQDRLAGQTTGWSSLGVTVAATHSGDTERIRTALPHALFLVLGYGAQGASASEAVRGFRRGPAGLEGGVVSSSRAILFPAFETAADAWEKAVRSALARATGELGEAVA